MSSIIGRIFSKSVNPLAILFFLVLCATFTHAKMNIVLLAGQSNMSGRGIIRIPDDTITYKNIVSLNKDSLWVRAKNPLHWDKSEAGVGMGISFAHELSALLKNSDTIALVPCAAGGTTIDNWLNNSLFGFTGNFYLYSNLINRAKKAAKNGAIIGMIWHQGESDATAALYPTYQNKLKKLFDSIRSDLKLPTMPIVAGELGRYLAQNNTYPRWDSVNVAIHNLKNVLQQYEVASSLGLTSNSDITHFTSASQDTLGIRYAKLFFSLIDTSHTGVLQSPREFSNHGKRQAAQNSIQFPQDFLAGTNAKVYNVSGRIVKPIAVTKTKNLGLLRPVKSADHKNVTVKRIF